MGQPELLVYLCIFMHNLGFLSHYLLLPLHDGSDLTHGPGIFFQLLHQRFYFLQETQAQLSVATVSPSLPWHYQATTFKLHLIYDLDPPVIQFNLGHG